MDVIIRLFDTYKLISDDVLINLNQTGQDIVADIQIESLFDDEDSSISPEEIDAYMDYMDVDEVDFSSEDLVSVNGLLIRPKQYLEQIINSAKQSPEAMIDACTSTVDAGDYIIFPKLLKEAENVLNKAQLAQILDYAASSDYLSFAYFFSQTIEKFDEMPIFSPKAKSQMLAFHVEELAMRISSAYWGTLSDKEKLENLGDESYEKVAEEIHLGISGFVGLEDYPPYSRGDLKTLEEYLLGLIKQKRIGAGGKISNEMIFEICRSWGERLKEYGLVASMKTEKA